MSFVGPIAAKKLQGRECRKVFSLQQNSVVIRSSRPHRRTSAIRGTGDMECGLTKPASLRLDVEGPDHLAPLLGFVEDELTKIARRARKHRAAHVGDPRLDLGIG